jgi:dTDP-L-rhamnose 4-epimerase
MRVLVTGGAGFIGSHITAALADRGHEPVGFDRREGTDIRGDVRDSAAVAAALAGVDAVCHQAAVVGHGKDFSDAPDYTDTNDCGTAVLLAAMVEAGVTPLVLAGSMIVYGEGRYECADHGAVRPGPRAERDLAAGRFDPTCPRCGAALRPGLVTEDAQADPRNIYAVTKLTQEHLAAVWARSAGGCAVSLRYHNVYGPGMPRDTPYAGVASTFCSALEHGESPRVYEDGTQRRDFVHVRDVATANVLALEAAAGGELPDGELRLYNTSSGEVRTVGEMAAELAAAYGGPKPVVTGEYRLGDVRHITAGSQRLAAELGWRPEVGFATGMAEFAKARLAETPSRQR